MANRSSNAPDAIATVATPADGCLAPQILTMFRAFMASPQRNKIVLLGVALVAVLPRPQFSPYRLEDFAMERIVLRLPPVRLSLLSIVVAIQNVGHAALSGQLWRRIGIKNRDGEGIYIWAKSFEQPDPV